MTVFQCFSDVVFFEKGANKLFGDANECVSFEHVGRRTFMCAYTSNYICIWLCSTYICVCTCSVLPPCLCALLRASAMWVCQGHRCHNVAAGLPVAPYGKGD